MDESRSDVAQIQGYIDQRIGVVMDRLDTLYAMWNSLQTHVEQWLTADDQMRRIEAQAVQARLDEIATLLRAEGGDP